METASSQPPPARNYGIDALKGVCILLVLAWHTEAISIDLGGRPETLARAAERLTAFFYWNISLLAVPTFLTVSLWLYAEHRGDAAGLGRKLLRLVALYVGWSVVWVATAYLSSGAQARATLWRDGGTLPGVGGSVLWFLLVLAVLTVLMEAAVRIPARLQSAAALWALAVLTAAFAYSYWRTPIILESPWCFLPAVPVALLLHNAPQMVRRWQPALLLGWVLVVILEYVFREYVYSEVGTYARMSLYLGAATLMSLFGSLNWTREQWLPRLGQITLGVFILHKYVESAVLTVLPSWPVWVGGAWVSVDRPVLFALTLVITALAVATLRRTRLRHVV
jgi:fucose 4-O-acetylase-like acetyltransferase